ncbi:hypothetical protein WICANDRAFT_65399 [Wickerhamomyces anomalus NRRL Y-366-8]|uniref:Zn(2)-C6 fungal-type domain-containing protein n=1 Tax=Wickerhamomyces anomalus (strain ATCC 58044 / CBS 1984 / NCYC 433 / NRRL Y-366-8) TaxID=683960 RepID=A0A1E3NVG7_WICAA|nr:uncharacterized protein WICANDRAFT_65399 [Wickerhamomyces anomalus NRRL Y-366-8]ODQ57138.1 hypothetical protein WICANDRAFT_65399 [Wickerhamomyces anomalus NRRL Y-366-8]
MSVIHNLLNEKDNNEAETNNIIPNQSNNSLVTPHENAPQVQIPFPNQQSYAVDGFQQQHQQQYQQQWNSQQSFQQQGMMMQHQHQQPQQHPIHNQPFQPLHPQQQFYQGVPNSFYPPQNIAQQHQFQNQQQIPQYPQYHHQHQQLPQRPISKRKRTPTTTARRRTMTACESCRLRKIKCDLGKPVCGGCTKSDLNCVYRNVKKEADDLSKKITKIAGITKEEPRIPTWSSCNWYTKAEGVLKWPIFENKYHVRSLNTVLGENNEIGLPEIPMLSREDFQLLNTNLKQNIPKYVDGYLSLIQTKNPFIDSKALLRTSDFIRKKVKENPDVDLFSLRLPDDMIPMSLVVLCSASASIARPLTFTNHQEYSNSQTEKSETYELSYKLYILAQNLNIVPKSMIPSFSLNHVQFHLLCANYLMYIMKPLEAWNCIYKASTLVMTILETYKSSGRKFTEAEHRILERVFHTCVKYESEFRVELSPSVPSSGVVNYPFPSIYPSPPIETINSVNEESSWFFYLTEIVLRKFENRLLDEFFVPTGVAGESTPDGEFQEDKYDLNWNKYDMETIMKKSLGYLEDLGKIENSMISHLRSILKEDPTSGVLQPHGFLFKTKSTLAPTESKSPASATTASTSEFSISKQNSPLPLTPSSADSNSPASSDLSQRAEKAIPDVPETINFIRTRMIVLKILLFRPLVYLFIHDKSNIYDSHPFIEQVLSQCFENIDTVNVPLACHRHFGSWFYARNVFLSVICIFGLFKRVGEKYTSKAKVEAFFKDVETILDYWVDEAPDLAEPRSVVSAIIEELRSL